MVLADEVLYKGEPRSSAADEGMGLNIRIPVGGASHKNTRRAGNSPPFIQIKYPENSVNPTKCLVGLLAGEPILRQNTASVTQ